MWIIGIQNPDYITGQTCPNCLDTYNPYFIVAGDLITEGNQVCSIFTGAKPLIKAPALNFDVFPNPSHGSFGIRYMNNTTHKPTDVNLIDISGKTLRSFLWNGHESTMTLPGLPKGHYVLKFNSRSEIVI